MIDGGWSRPAERIVLDEGDLLAEPWQDVEALQQVVDSGCLRERGVEVWRTDGWERKVRFDFPPQVPCVTALGRQ